MLGRVLTGGNHKVELEVVKKMSANAANSGVTIWGGVPPST
jgi:hypothetical protein